MNDLEQWLADVKVFNADVVAELASVRLKVEMPEESDDLQA